MTDVFNRFSKNNGLDNADPMIWGGKGAGLARMAAKGYPVPPGFTISTEMCKLYQKSPEAVMTAIMADIEPHLQFIWDQFGYMPLLSVRSGAPVSMPGMMDTILNVGMNMSEFPAWSDRIGNRAAWDSYRRLVQMMGSTCYDIPKDVFEEIMHQARVKAKVETDAELDAVSLEAVFGRFVQIYKNHNLVLKTDLHSQLRDCIEAVFKSWMNERAVEYRAIEGIDEAMGTAVTVQAMVFGNMNDQSGSGVLFTRNPSTGENLMYGEFLPNAQGEDVVAGIRTPMDVWDMNTVEMQDTCWPAIYDQLVKLCSNLELDYADMVDIEFTVQDKELFVLQSRAGKRSAQAAFCIAVEMMAAQEIGPATALGRVKRKHLSTVLRPAIDPKFKEQPAGHGIAGSQGIAIGKVVRSSADAVALAKTGEKVILVSEETTPEDIAGMNASVGILTRTGGATSHAAVVARGMDKPCVVGCTEMQLGAGYVDFGKHGQVKVGDTISIDGATGRVWVGEVPVVGGALDEYATKFIDMLLSFNSIVRSSPVPVAGASIPLADWMAKTDDEIDALVGKLQEVAKAGGHMLLDVTPPTLYGEDCDNAIWSIAGPPVENSKFVERVLAKVAHAEGLTGLEVVGGTADIRSIFELTGFNSLPHADTVAELLSSNGIVKMSPGLAAVMSDEALAKLAAAGLFTGQLMSETLPPMYAAYKLLAE